MTLDILELGRAARATTSPCRSRSSSPPATWPRADGMEVLCDTSQHVQRGAHDVQEFLLLNHPVDCPICDQSGECKLQDYWLEHDQHQKRMRDEPIHKPKGVVFGPTIVYDAERCVMCTRCVRFMDEVAKDPVLDMRERGNLNEIIVSPGRQLDGALHLHDRARLPGRRAHDEDFRFKARVWFLRTARTRVPGLRDGVQRAPRLRPSVQQGVPLPPARQREGQQVLDVRRGDAHLPARRRGPDALRRWWAATTPPSRTRCAPPRTSSRAHATTPRRSPSCSRRSTRTRTTSPWSRWRRRTSAQATSTSPAARSAGATTS